jgi:dihydroorotase-like cyclic amidohydrolase
MSEVDLAVNGGLVVSSRGRRRANVLVQDGRIVHVGNDTATARRVVDASGLVVLPGGVDTHVHLMDPGPVDREDFPTGTAAAAANGVTTILEHTHAHPVRTVSDLEAKRRHVGGRALVDYGLAAHGWPGYDAHAAELWAAGVAFFKVFTCTTHGVPGHDAARLKRHLEACAAVGAMTLMHCEDESLTEDAEAVLRSAGRDDGGIVPEWRSRDAELVAVTVASLLVRLTGARASVAHVSNPDAAGAVAGERAVGRFSRRSPARSTSCSARRRC